MPARIEELMRWIAHLDRNRNPGQPFAGSIVGPARVSGGGANFRNSSAHADQQTAATAAIHSDLTSGGVVSLVINSSLELLFDHHIISTAIA